MAQNCKYYKEKKQVSYDNGVTYVDVSPAEYRKGDLIESSSTDCGYSPTPSGYSNQYLTFVAVDSGTFKFNGSSSSTVNNSSILYSTDNGSTWNTLNRNVNSPTISAGQKIMWKSSTLIPTVNGIGLFLATGRFNAEGNIMSLLYGDNFRNQTSLNGKNYAFNELFFYCTELVSAGNLVLPATTLVENCYRYMFSNCTSLTTAPVLPATTLANGCYFYMFRACTSLNYVKCLATNISAISCTDNWLADVASTGTFVKNGSMSSWTRGVNGIPSNWAVENA